MNDAGMSGKLLSIAVLQALTIFAGLLRAKGLALLLGPAGFGVASIIDQVVVTLVTLGAFGLPFAALKFMAHSYSEEPAAFERAGAGFLQLIVALGLITALVGSVAIAWRPGTFGADLAGHQGLLQVAVLGVPSGMLLMLFVNTLAAARRPAAAAAFNLVIVSAVALAAVAGAWLYGLEGLYDLSVATTIITTTAALLYFARALGIRFATWPTGIIASLRRQPEIIGYSLCFYATFASSTVMLLLLRTTVLSRLGEVAAGQLQAAFSIALTVGAVLYPLSNLYLGPLVNSRGSPAHKLRTVDSVASRMLVLFLVGATPVVLFPEVLLRLLFSDAFAPASTVLWLFVLWQCIFQIGYVYQQLLIGLDDVAFAAVVLIGGCGTAIALSNSMITLLGLGGVAVALASGMAVWGLAVILRLRIRHRALISRRMLIRLGSVMLIVCVTGRQFAGRHELDAGTVAVRLLVGASVLVLCWFLLDPRERNPRLWLAALLPTGESD